jgi:large subunit ribosomal protein L6
MSRIGRKPIVIDPGVTVSIKDGEIVVVGPKGQLNLKKISGVKIDILANSVEIKPESDSPDTSLVGLCRSLIQNAITGVTKGWSKSLELVGVGFRAQNKGADLELHVGFSHPVVVVAPQGITFAIVENKITVSGSDKYLVGEIAASVKRIKPPEPYKGKGIRYVGEVIRKKLGKAAKAVGGAAGAK